MEDIRDDHCAASASLHLVMSITKLGRLCTAIGLSGFDLGA